MKRITGLGYLAAVALVTASFATTPTSVQAGNAYGRDGNPGNANGHAENGGPAAGGNGGMASARGSLNAAHASASGLEHASDKSRVGMLADYMDAMVVYEAAYEEVDWDAYDDLLEEIAAIDDQIADLQEEIDDLDPEDPDYDSDKEDLEGQIGDLEDDKADLQAEADALTAEVDAAADDAAGHLEDAANKDGLIDETVVDGVNSLLDGKSEDFSHNDIVHQSEGQIVEIINPSE